MQARPSEPWIARQIFFSESSPQAVAEVHRQSEREDQCVIATLPNLDLVLVRRGGNALHADACEHLSVDVLSGYDAHGGVTDGFGFLPALGVKDEVGQVYDW